jgi:hypothetical protein
VSCAAGYLAAIQQPSTAARSATTASSRDPDPLPDQASESVFADNNGCAELRDGRGVYWDRYRKIDGKWLIADTKYERIYEMNQHLSEEPKFHASYLAKYGQKLHE